MQKYGRNSHYSICARPDAFFPSAFSLFFRYLPNLLPDTPNGFGRYWLGNLFGAFGMTLEQIESSGISCRGTFDPDFCAVACLCGPDVDESSEFCLSEDGRLRFSTISAWDKCDDVDSLIVERFPSVGLAWSVTDEFGNFHYTHNPDGLTELPAFALNGLLYSEDDLDELAGDLRAFINIPDGANAGYFCSDAVRNKINAYNDACSDGDETVSLDVFEQV